MIQTPTTRVRGALPGALYGVLALTDAVLATGPARWQRARVVTKPLLMPVLASRTLTAPTRPGEPERGLLAAQALSWGGDLALMSSGRRSFLTGVGLFFGAHLSYLSALRSRPTTPILGSPGRRWFLAAGGLLAAGMGLAAARRDRALGVPVTAYAGTLAVMVAAAAAVEDDDRAELLSGAGLFLVSDSVLGIRTFLVGEQRPVAAALHGVVMATYTAAQWRLGAGLSRR